MFTGIVSAVGEVAEAGGFRLAIRHAPTARQLNVGGSVAVNGCCLTATRIARGTFYADVVPETLRRTNLGALGPGSRVNLELPLRSGGRLDGHMVQGHVDGVGRVLSIKKVGAGSELAISLPASIARFVAEKGSITLDGMSLTVVKVHDSPRTFTVALIPHTLSATIAGGYARGTKVNLEADVVARYAGRLLQRS